MVGLLNITAPIHNSHTNGDIETQLSALYVDVIDDLLKESVSDIHHYGMPHFGSSKVVERFTKQDGLAVLRRPNSSDTIMRVIYANWKSLGSKRGLGFLEFVLQMLLGDKWETHRLYHSKNRTANYPSLSTTQKFNDSFLTSRVMIDLDQDVDFEEILELAPILFKLVPANIVPSLSSNVDFEDISELNLAMAYIPYMCSNMQYFDDYNQIELPTLPWSVNRYLNILENGYVRYFGSKNENNKIIKGTALINIRPYLAQQLAKPKFQNMELISVVLSEITGDVYIGGNFDIRNQNLEIAIVSDDYEFIDVVGVYKQRLLVGGDAIKEFDSLALILDHMGFFVANRRICESVESDISKRSMYIYKVGGITSYVGVLDLGRQYIENQKEHNSAWSNRVVGQISLISQINAHTTEIAINFTENNISDFVVLTVSRSLNPDYISPDSQGTHEVDLERLVLEFEKWREISYQGGQFEGLRIAFDKLIRQAYNFDNFSVGNNLFNENKKDLSFSELIENIIYLIGSDVVDEKQQALNFIQTTAETTFNSNISEQLVKQSELIALFKLNQDELIVNKDPFLKLKNISHEVVEYV